MNVLEKLSCTIDSRKQNNYLAFRQLISYAIVIVRMKLTYKTSFNSNCEIAVIAANAAQEVLPRLGLSEAENYVFVNLTDV